MLTQGSIVLVEISNGERVAGEIIEGSVEGRPLARIEGPLTYHPDGYRRGSIVALDHPNRIERGYIVAKARARFT